MNYQQTWFQPDQLVVTTARAQNCLDELEGEECCVSCSGLGETGAVLPLGTCLAFLLPITMIFAGISLHFDYTLLL